MVRFFRWALDGWARLGRRWQVGILASFSVALIAASVAGYRTWHYVQHDNRFCTSCHLMVDPFQRFGRSAHARLECHNCHKATLRAQLHQLYATVVEQPAEIARHAHVPNQVCGTCHIRGEPTRWKIIASTAGHRIHLESRDPALRGIQCVDCHSVSVHQFAPVDRTCGRSGCHADLRIGLGPMRDAELHCTTCHNYLAEASGMAVDSLGRPLTPRAQQCLRCHAMQERLRNLELGLDPHRGVCGDCHNPHTQTEAQAVSCTSSTCHEGWRAVSFHIGVAHPERCTTCHLPHSWRVEGANCIRCHADVGRQSPTRPSRVPVRRAAPLASDVLAKFTGASGAGPLAAEPQGTRRPSAEGGATRFSHGDHRGQTCASCHSSRLRHGELLVRSPADCQRCHHVGAGRDQCVTCHTAADLRRPVQERVRTFPLLVGRATVTRRLALDHERHAAVSCVRCHSNPLSRAPAGADCASCHASHHRSSSDCPACHAAASPLAKHRAEDHPNCATASCHGARAQGLPASREACLMCHRAQVRHVPGRACEQCHRVMEAEAR